MEERLSEISSGFIQAKILMTGAELRVFDPVAGDGATAGAVAEKVGGTVRGVEILLDALTAMKILEKSGDVYHLRSEYEPFLLENSPTHFPAGLRHRNRMFRRDREAFGRWNSMRPETNSPLGATNMGGQP